MATVSDRIALYDKTSGALIRVRARADYNAALEGSNLAFSDVPAEWPFGNLKWSATAKAFQIDLALLEEELIDSVKSKAEQLKMQLLSSGGAKKAEYAEKRAEVVAYDSLASGVGGIVQALTTLSTARRQAMFAHATADAAAFGDTIAAAIERFRAGMAKSNKAPLIAAAEAKACAAIRAATSAAGKRAAAVVVWPA